MANSLSDLFGVFEQIEHVDVDSEDIRTAENFPSLVAAIATRLFDNCRTILPSFVLGRVLIGKGQGSLDYFRDSPFIPFPGKCLDRFNVAALLTYIRFSGLLKSASRGGGITRRLFQEAKAPQRLRLISTEGAYTGTAVPFVCLSDPPLPHQNLFQVTSQRIREVVDRVVDEQKLARLDDDQSVDAAFGTPEIDWPNEPEFLSYSLVRLWLETAGLKCYWLCGNPFPEPYPWGGIYFLANQVPYEHEILTTGFLSREIFLRAHLIEQVRVAAHLQAESSRLQLYAEATGEIQDLLRTLHHAQGKVTQLSRLFNVQPASIIRYYTRPGEEMIPDTDSPYFQAKWTFRHRWPTRSIATNQEDFAAQVSCILRVFNEEELPSQSAPWIGSPPWSNLNGEKLAIIANLMGYNLSSLENPSTIDTKSSSDFFTFLRQCFYSPHKQGKKLTLCLLVLWAVEKGRMAADIGRTILNSSLYAETELETVELGDLEALRQHVEDTTSSESLVNVAKTDDSCVRVSFAGASATLVDNVNKYVSLRVLPTSTTGSLEGPIFRLRLRGCTVTADRQQISIKMKFIEKKL